jgi:hypothetical protein
VSTAVDQSQSGHQLWQRYCAEGAVGLQPRSRAPLHHSNAVDEAVIVQLLAARRRHPSWGPRSLLD